MNLADTLRALWRRWYIVVPGLLVAVAVAFGAWQVIEPDYQRSGAQLLLPGSTSIPDNGNPYLYLGGLSPAADVLVTAMNSERELGPLLDGHPGAEIAIVRDPLTSGPQLLTTVTAGSDVEAQEILAATLERTTAVLAELQDVDGVTRGNRISIESITVDTQSTLVQRNRLLGVAASGLGVLVLTLLTAALVEGLSTRRRAVGAAVAESEAADAGGDDDEDAADEDDDDQNEDEADDDQNEDEADDDDAADEDADADPDDEDDAVDSVTTARSSR